MDDLVGKGPITVDHLTKLPYLNAVLRESLRLSPTAPSVGLTAKQDTVLDGKYPVSNPQCTNTTHETYTDFARYSIGQGRHAYRCLVSHDSP